MNTLRMATLIALIVCPSGNAFAEPLHLAGAVRIALDRSPEIGAARSRVKEAEANLRAARLYENPEAEGEVAREDPEGKYEWGAGLRMPLDVSGQVRYRTQAAEAALRGAKLEENDASRKVGAAAAAAYIEAVLAVERVRLAEANLNLRERLFTIADEKYLVGDVPMLERALATAEVADARARVKRGQGQAQEAWARLAGALFLPTRELTEIGRDIWVEPPLGDLAVLSEKALRGRSDVDALLQRAEAESGTALALYAERWAGVSVGAGFSRQWDGEEQENVARIGFSIPLPIINRREGERDAARARAQALLHEADARRREILADLEAAFNRLKEADDAFALYNDEVVRLTADNAARMEEAYGYGSVTASAVIQAEERYSSALEGFLEALEERSKAASLLIATVGEPWTSREPSYPTLPVFNVPDLGGDTARMTSVASISPVADTAPMLRDTSVMERTSQLTRDHARNAVEHDSTSVSPVSVESGRSYTVRAGDTLFGIAARELGNGKYWQEIAVLNGLEPPYLIKEGTQIRLPLMRNQGE
jgi:outer membrane protein, heavy metal efflux system